MADVQTTTSAEPEGQAAAQTAAAQDATLLTGQTAETPQTAGGATDGDQTAEQSTEAEAESGAAENYEF